MRSSNFLISACFIFFFYFILSCSSQEPSGTRKIHDFVHTWPSLFTNASSTLGELDTDLWDVSDVCVPGKGYLATPKNDFPLILRFDGSGSVIGYRVLAKGSAGITWPFLFTCETDGPAADPNCHSHPFAGDPWPGLIGMHHHFIADIWFRDPSKACESGNGNIWEIYAFGAGAQVPLPMTREEGEAMGWLDVVTCVPLMGSHLVFPPQVFDFQDFTGPASMALPVDMAGNVIGIDLISMLDQELPYWEHDTVRPDKPVENAAWHIYYITSHPGTGKTYDLVEIAGEMSPQTLVTQCQRAELPGAALPGVPPTAPLNPDYRTADGTFNSEDAQFVMRGASFTPYGRLTPHYYADFYGSNITATEALHDWKNPRVVSNEIFSKPVKISPRRGSDMQTFWGMMITLDICGTVRNNVLEHGYPIKFPIGDPVFDPWGKWTEDDRIFFQLPGAGPVPYSGRPNSPTSEVRLTINEKTSFLDADWLYGAWQTQQYMIRTWEGGHIHSPWFIQNYGITPESYGKNPFRRGDIRVNKSPPMIALHSIFLAEHNWRADNLAEENPDWDDETLFQEARRWVIAIIQAISAREYLAALTGEPLPPYVEQGYDPTMDPSVTSEFCHAAFRYGHAELRPTYLRSDARFEVHETGNVLMRNAHWTHAHNNQSGHEPFLRGLVQQQQAAVDLSIIEDVRSHLARHKFLDTAPNDLGASNIQRGRDVGLPPYNLMRQQLGLTPLTSIDEITSDQDYVESLKSIYGSIDDVECYAGGLAEDHVDQTSLGELFLYIVRDQFERIRRADRFWFENPDAPLYNETFVAEIYATKLETVIARHTEINDEIGKGIFFIQSRQLNTLFADGVIGDREIVDTTGQFHDDVSLQLSNNYRIWWKLTDNKITFQLKTLTTGWMGIGFDPAPNSMRLADIYIGRVFVDEETGEQTAEVRDYFALDVGPPIRDIDIPESQGGPGTDDVEDVWGAEEDGSTFVVFTRKLKTDDDFDKNIPFDDKIKTIFAFNPETDELKYHGPTRSADEYINFYIGRYTPLNLVDLSTWVKVIIGLFTGLMIVITFIFLLLLVVKKEHFRFMSPTFCMVTLAAALIVYTGIMTLLKDPPSDASCGAYIWLVGIGLALFFSAIFAKTFRVWKLISSNSLKAKVITDKQLFIPIGIVVLIQIIYLAIWTGVDTLEAEEYIHDDDDFDYHIQCESDSDAWWATFIALNSLIFVVGTILAFLSRGLPDEFNDASPIAWSMYSLFVLQFAVIVLGYTFENDKDIATLIMGVGPLLGLTIVTFLLFGPVAWRILVQGKGPREFKSTIGSSRGSGGSSLSGLSSTSDD